MSGKSGICEHDWQAVSLGEPQRSVTSDGSLRFYAVVRLVCLKCDIFTIRALRMAE